MSYPGIEMQKKGTNMEGRLREVLQGKSHKFLVGNNKYTLSFIKTECGEIKDVEFICVGANSLPRGDNNER